MSDAVDRAADELYGEPLDEFIGRRDALAKELRAGGDRAAADAVKRLPKPTAPAWAINRLAREQPDDVAALLRAGEDLRNVQEWLLRREADPSDLRGAVESERAAVGRLVNRAADLLTEAGRAPRGDVLERIGETLHAAAADPDVREDVKRGRVVRDRAAVGLGPTVPAGAARRAGGRKRATSAEETEAGAPAPPKPSAAAREALRAARADAVEAERARTAAERAVERAGRRLEEAEETWSRAQDELREARDQLASARESVDEAREAADAANAEVDRRGEEA
jgi:hypothetical protein